MLSRLALPLAAVFALLAATMARAEVILINAFEVPAGREEAAIAAWHKARDFLKQQPGYIDTALHQAVSPGARFALVNIARWESRETFEAATSRLRETTAFPPVAGLSFHPALYRVVFEDRKK